MKITYLICLFFLCVSCSFKPAEEKQIPWAGAKWIAWEVLPDSLKLVPGVHGKGNHLEEKCIRTAVIPMVRKNFRTEGEITSARIKICGLGQYLLFINGRKIGERFLSPGWSLYQKKYFYNTYDVTTELREGENAIGALAGTGFYYISRERYRKLVIAYGYPQLIFDLEVKYRDGSISHIISDQDCRISPSPVTFSSIYGGEDYDARMEQEGWNEPGFDDSNWKIPVVVKDSLDKLTEEDDFPVRVMQEFETRNISISETGRTIYDFGQNASGIISIRVKGKRGSEVIIRPSELLDEQGNITQRSSGGPYELHYILSGKGVEEWQPFFSYYGFRYADVEIIETETSGEKTKVLELKMKHTRNSSPTVGSFECSDTLFNRIFELINWGIKSNMASVATDCPHREKLGWLEQTYLIGPSMHYNYDIHRFYRKIVNDIIDSQTENGLIPDIAPEYVHFKDGFRDSPEWGSAGIIIPWQLYKWYGDEEVLHQAWPLMKKYAAYLKSRSENNLLDYGLGDWYDLGPEPPGVSQLTPVALTASSVYYYDLVIMSHVAEKLGFNDDARYYSELSGEVRKAFLDKFYDSETGMIATGSQTSYAMPLYTGLIPEGERIRVLENLVDSIKENDYALTSGDIGYHFLVRVLSEYGRSDILYRMNNRLDRPGYGYQLSKGATALTESWKALPTSSNNHMMLGHLMEWFYSGPGGIYQSPSSTAYREIIIAPKPVGDMKWVRCSFNSPAGLISSAWEIVNNTFMLKLEIPEKSSAKLILPDDFPVLVRIYNQEKEKELTAASSDSCVLLEGGKYYIEARKN